jgi:hypothetical protein
VEEGALEAARHEARERGGERVADDDSGGNRAAVDVERAREGRADHDEREERELLAVANERALELDLVRAAEDVALDLLPAAVVAERLVRAARGAALLVVVAHLARLVRAERAHEDERDEAAEEDDHHEGVEEREPMDLVLEERAVELAREARRKGALRRHPVHRVRERLALPRLDGDGVLRREVDLDDAVAVVRDGDVLVEVELGRVGDAVRALRVRLDLGNDVLVRDDLADHRPHRELVKLHLLPVVVRDGVGEELRARLVEVHRADGRAGHVRLEMDLEVTVLELAKEVREAAEASRGLEALRRVAEGEALEVVLRNRPGGRARERARESEREQRGGGRGRGKKRG